MIPSYRVAQHVCGVIAQIPLLVSAIYVVDDACPDQSGAFVQKHCTDPRVKILFNPVNLGVGGATMAGYRAAIEAGAAVIVKIDGDGQMDPTLIGTFIQPLLAGEADYTKGNRFYDLEMIKRMPAIRIFGNAVLSLLTKLSSG